MGFRGKEFVFDSPAAAIAGMVDALSSEGIRREGVSIGLHSARGRMLAESVRCDRDSPAFDYAAMDGYAVRTADVAKALRVDGTRETIVLKVIGEARIGCAPPDLARVHDAAGSSAIRIVTGAAIPAGADGIIKREDVSEHAAGDTITSISISRPMAIKVCEGSHIRRRGENARAGDVVIDSGTELGAAAIGTLASVGCSMPRVFPCLRIAVITTGDELVPPESTPGTYQVRNSNASAIRAAIGAQAWLTLVSPDSGEIVSHVRDESREMDVELHRALACADAIVITGGVSMGHRDPVRAAVESVGAEIVFHGLPQRPGKPMLGAVVRRADGAGVPIFGLPGNPISAMVTCVRIVLPVVAILGGASSGQLPQMCTPRLVPLKNADGKTLDMWWHRLVKMSQQGEAELVDGRGSGDIIAGGRSHGFVEVTPASPQVSGTLVPFYQWPI